MALHKTIETQGVATLQTPIGFIENGVQTVSFPAYIKVVSISGNKSQLNVTVSFKGDNQQFNKQYEVPVSVTTGSINFIAQIYQYLKTLPEFEGSEDC